MNKQERCGCCGTPQHQWNDEPDSKVQEINNKRIDKGRMPYCSYGCMAEKLGLW